MRPGINNIWPKKILTRVIKWWVNLTAVKWKWLGNIIILLSEWTCMVYMVACHLTRQKWTFDKRRKRRQALHSPKAFILSVEKWFQPETLLGRLGACTIFNSTCKARMVADEEGEPHSALVFKYGWPAGGKSSNQVERCYVIISRRTSRRTSLHGRACVTFLGALR